MSGQFVELSFSLFPRKARLIQEFSRHRRRVSLVNPGDGNSSLLTQPIPERNRLFGFLALIATHVDRQANDEADHLFDVDQILKILRVQLRRSPVVRFQWT